MICFADEIHQTHKISDPSDPDSLGHLTYTFNPVRHIQVDSFWWLHGSANKIIL